MSDEEKKTPAEPAAWPRREYTPLTKLQQKWKGIAELREARDRKARVHELNDAERKQLEKDTVALLPNIAQTIAKLKAQSDRDFFDSDPESREEVLVELYTIAKQPAALVQGTRRSVLRTWKARIPAFVAQMRLGVYWSDLYDARRRLVMQPEHVYWAAMYLKTHIDTDRPKQFNFFYHRRFDMFGRMLKRIGFDPLPENNRDWLHYGRNTPCRVLCPCGVGQEHLRTCEGRDADQAYICKGSAAFPVLSNGHSFVAFEASPSNALFVFAETKHAKADKGPVHVLSGIPVPLVHVTLEPGSLTAPLYTLRPRAGSVLMVHSFHEKYRATVPGLPDRPRYVLSTQDREIHRQFLAKVMASEDPSRATQENARLFDGLGLHPDVPKPEATAVVLAEVKLQPEPKAVVVAHVDLKTPAAKVPVVELETKSAEVKAREEKSQRETKKFLANLKNHTDVVKLALLELVRLFGVGKVAIQHMFADRLDLQHADNDSLAVHEEDAVAVLCSHYDAKYAGKAEFFLIQSDMKKEEQMNVLHGIDEIRFFEINEDSKAAKKKPGEVKSPDVFHMYLARGPASAIAKLDDAGWAKQTAVRTSYANVAAASARSSNKPRPKPVSLQSEMRVMNAANGKMKLQSSDAIAKLKALQQDVGDQRVEDLTRALDMKADDYKREDRSSHAVREIPRPSTAYTLAGVSIGAGDLKALLRQASVQSHTEHLLRMFQEANGALDEKTLIGELAKLPKPAETVQDVYVLLVPPLHRLYRTWKRTHETEYVPNPLICAFVDALVSAPLSLSVWCVALPYGMALLIDKRTTDANVRAQQLQAGGWHCVHAHDRIDGITDPSQLVVRSYDIRKTNPAEMFCRRQAKPFNILRGILSVAPNLARVPTLTPVDMSKVDETYVYPLAVFVHQSDRHMQVSNSFSSRAILARNFSVYAEPSSAGFHQGNPAETNAQNVHMIWGFAGDRAHGQYSTVLLAAEFKAGAHGPTEDRGEVYAGSTVPAQVLVKKDLETLGLSLTTEAGTSARLVRSLPVAGVSSSSTSSVSMSSTSSVSSLSTSSASSARTSSRFSFHGATDSVHLLDCDFNWDTKRFGSPWIRSPSDQESKALADATASFAATVLRDCERGISLTWTLPDPKPGRQIFACTIAETAARMTQAVDTVIAALEHELKDESARVVSLRWMGSRIIFVVFDSEPTRLGTLLANKWKLYHIGLWTLHSATAAANDRRILSMA